MPPFAPYRWNIEPSDIQVEKLGLKNRISLIFVINNAILLFWIRDLLSNLGIFIRYRNHWQLFVLVRIHLEKYLPYRNLPQQENLCWQKESSRLSLGQPVIFSKVSVMRLNKTLLKNYKITTSKIWRSLATVRSWLWFCCEAHDSLMFFVLNIGRIKLPSW